MGSSSAEVSDRQDRQGSSRGRKRPVSPGRRCRARARAAASTAAGASPRRAFIAALRGARLDDGVCAPATIGADGQLVREPTIHGVDAGAIVAVPY